MPCRLCPARKPSKKRHRSRRIRLPDRMRRWPWISGPSIEPDTRRCAIGGGNTDACRFQAPRRPETRLVGLASLDPPYLLYRLTMRFCMTDKIRVSYAEAPRRDSRCRPAAVSAAELDHAVDRGGRPVAVRSCRDGRLVERPTDVRRDDQRRRPGTTALESRRAMAGRDRRVSGQRRAAAVFARRALRAMIGITGKRYGWLNLLRAALLHLPCVRFLVQPDTDDSDRIASAAVLFAGGGDGRSGRRRRSGAEPGRPADRAGRPVAQSLLPLSIHPCSLTSRQGEAMRAATQKDR